MATVLAQVYCTAQDVIQDLQLRGFEDKALLERIKGASEVILRKEGNFIPVSEIRKFGAKAGGRFFLDVDPVLEIISITNEGEAVTDYYPSPVNRMWADGPYIEIELDGYWAERDGVVITGRWGKYDKVVSLGIKGTQNATATDLAVANGSLLSPGMVIKINDEQEFVTEGMGSNGSPAGTAATSKVSGAIDELDASITVDNGAEFFPGEVIQIGVEDMKILKINGHVLAVERGWNGTAPADHLDDAGINVYRTFTVERGVNGTVADSHADATISQMKVPDAVNYLCRQIASLMRMKAASGFSGITGDSEMGQGKYLSEFPPKTISTVLEPYKIWSD